VGRSLAPYLDRLSASMARHIPWRPRLAVSELGPSATVVGAVATALWLDRERATPQVGRRNPVSASVVSRAG
jgi:hypothetical protein